MSKVGRIAVITIAIFVIITLIGEASVYWANPYHCSVDISRSGTEVQYSFDTNINKEYTCVTLDNSSNHTNGYLAYYDEDDAASYLRDDVLQSLTYLKDTLAKFDIDMRFIDTAELTEIVTNNDTSKAIVFATGRLPGSIYEGGPSDPIFGWLSAGGFMYWLGSPIGREYFDGTGIHWVSDPDTLFYGVSGVSRDWDPVNGSVYGETLTEGSITDVTQQYYNECTFGIDVSRLTTQYSVSDYSYNGYHSETFVKYHSGSGTIVVFGGGLQRYVVGPDTAQLVAQTMASRMTYDTTMIDHVEGANARGASGSVKCDASPTDVFVFLSKGDVVFGRNVTV